MNPAIYLLFLLLAKHLVCDGFLQTKTMVACKGIYGNGLGILHSLVHGIGTCLALLLFGAGGLVAAAVALFDFVFHYHVDFVKENVVRRQGWTVANPQFWWALMTDQFIHNVTYLGIAAYVAG